MQQFMLEIQRWVILTVNVVYVRDVYPSYLKYDASNTRK